MDALERRSVLALASVYLFRMLGLFLIMPIISIAADDLSGANAALIGAAIGVYGLTQALLQIPMGMMSDKIGRKPIILIGLTIFALGSLICANADSMTSLIVGRAIQGAGAIASTLMALLSDVTREQNRTKAMATVGISIGVSFMLSLVMGPWLFSVIGLAGLFYLSLAFSVIGMGLILFAVPNVKQHTFKRDTTPSLQALSRVFANKPLRFMNLSIFILHASLTALFVSIPSMLVSRFELPLADHSWLYLIVMGLAFVGMLPMVIVAEAKGKMKQVVSYAILMLAFGTLLMGFSSSVSLFAITLWLYFVGFNTLEATLPSLVSKVSPVGYRGTAMGIFSTHQFLGAFVGGIGGGWILQNYSSQTLFVSVAAIMFVWTFFATRQAPTRHLTSLAFSLQHLDLAQIDKLANDLSNVDGVEDMQIFSDEKTAYLKVDKKLLDKDKLLQLAPTVSV
ncbi:Major facilitator superfamily protein [Marinomonas sp. MED121]|uniref:MFS transporter n=1 Tax=Marinomonas sp. MED121 TaxID=314277 RepID=UPI00006902B3|nr:MFS transporter [Marinomonas sp. MED121]EAQ63244.1 Major facilitator superfamily protein [Marinomonas sp. MED121]